MTTFFRLICFGFSFIAITCTDRVNETSHKDDPKLDSSNPSITSGIDTNGTKKFTSYKPVPDYIKKYLDSLSGEKYLIAEPGESFSKGCIVSPGIPTRQIVWASINHDSFKMQYLQGGIALFNCLLTINFKEGKISGHKIEYL